MTRFLKYPAVVLIAATTLAGCSSAEGDDVAGTSEETAVEQVSTESSASTGSTYRPKSPEEGRPGRVSIPHVEGDINLDTEELVFVRGGGADGGIRKQIECTGGDNYSLIVERLGTGLETNMMAVGDEDIASTLSPELVTSVYPEISEVAIGSLDVNTTHDADMGLFFTVRPADGAACEVQVTSLANGDVVADEVVNGDSLFPIYQLGVSGS